MKHDIPISADPDAWLAQLFDCPAVRKGGLFRTTLAVIEAHAGLARFKDEVHRRGFRALENAGHVVVFCNREPVEILRPDAVRRADRRARTRH